jgi:hypothetical protein
MEEEDNMLLEFDMEEKEKRRRKEVLLNWVRTIREDEDEEEEEEKNKMKTKYVGW